MTGQDEASSLKISFDNEGRHDGGGFDESAVAARLQARYSGMFGRARFARDAMRAKVHRGWAAYKAMAAPEDDDAPDQLPRVFHGKIGRLLLAGASVVALGVWIGLVWLIWVK